MCGLCRDHELLLVVDERGADRLTFMVGSLGDERASLAIVRDGNRSGGCDLAGLLVGQLVMMFINFLDRTSVRCRIAFEGIVFAVKIAGPLVVRGVAAAVDAVDYGFDLITIGGIDHAGVLLRSGGNLRFRLVELP